MTIDTTTCAHIFRISCLNQKACIIPYGKPCRATRPCRLWCGNVNRRQGESRRQAILGLCRAAEKEDEVNKNRFFLPFRSPCTNFRFAEVRLRLGLAKPKNEFFILLTARLALTLQAHTTAYFSPQISSTKQYF